jgi:hypothetical protein
MRRDHMDVFFNVAEQFGCWIGVREPNPLADKWIGKSGYVPKGLNCKAQTSDNPAFRFAGLVVDPTARPEAFTKETLPDAKDTWKKKFLKGGRVPPGFACMSAGAEKGLVKFAGAAIFADYDLMAISRSNSRGEMLFTDQAQQGELFAKIEPILRQGLRVPMVQHPTEFMWDQGVGAREFEWVLWFGPGHRFNRLPSSMPKAGH